MPILLMVFYFIFKVNGMSIEHATHDEAVSIFHDTVSLFSFHVFEINNNLC